MKDEKLIPPGTYCYIPLDVENHGLQRKPTLRTLTCPYWSLNKDKPEQCNGHCSYLGRGDWDEAEGFGLLWDQVKECGVSDESLMDYDSEDKKEKEWFKYMLEQGKVPENRIDLVKSKI